MDKNLKILLYCLIGLTVANLLFTAFGLNSNLKKAIDLIDNTRDTINFAVKRIDHAKVQIDSANSVLVELRRKSERSGIEVEVINQQLLVKTEQVKSRSDSLKGLIKANLAKLDSLAP